MIIDLLTDKQKTRLESFPGISSHVEVEVSWAVFQRMVAAYRHATAASACGET